MRLALRCGVLLLAALAVPQSGSAKVTWYWDGPASTPAATLSAITAAMDVAIDYYNAYSDYQPQEYAPNANGIRVIYDAAVPTANASYKGRIAFGGSIGVSTALHEMGHVFGVGTYEPTWTNLLSGNLWTGSVATAQVREFDGASANVNGDGSHFWPYGLNFSTEDSLENRRRHVLMVGALRADMRLSNRNATEVLGDYNNDGVTDAADYTVYRDRFGDTTSLVNDSTIGAVDLSDLAWWKRGYGRTATASSASIPEPSAIALAMMVLVASRRRRRV